MNVCSSTQREKVANIQEQIGNLKDENQTDEPNVNVRNDRG